MAILFAFAPFIAFAVIDRTTGAVEGLIPTDGSEGCGRGYQSRLAPGFAGMVSPRR